MLFIWPGLCVCGGAGLAYMLAQIRARAMRAAFVTVCMLLVARPALWCIENHPYEYTYFNELGGGFKKAYYNYDTDYWEIALKNSVDWLMKNEPIANAKDTVTVAINNTAFARYYLQRNYPGSKVKLVPCGCIVHNAVFWQYAVFSSLFVEPDYLENCYPPKSSVHTENIDGLPVAAVLADLVRLDIKALEALNAGQNARADSLLTVFLGTTHDANPGIYALMSMIKAAEGKSDEAIHYGNLCLPYNLPTQIDYWNLIGLGIAYMEKKDFQKSIAYFNKASVIAPDDPNIKTYMALIHQQMAIGQAAH